MAHWRKLIFHTFTSSYGYDVLFHPNLHRQTETDLAQRAYIDKQMQPPFPGPVIGIIRVGRFDDQFSRLVLCRYFLVS